MRCSARPDLDGVVIATPSALHAEQSIAALESGLAVFCQKPLGRDAAEAAAVVAAARRADRLLGVDLSYRHLDGHAADAWSGARGSHRHGVRRVAHVPQRVRARQGVVPRPGALRRRVHDRSRHAPRRPRPLDDAGAELRRARRAAARGRRGARRRIATRSRTMRSRSSSPRRGAAISIACSWWLHAGRDAVIGAAFHGTHGLGRAAQRRAARSTTSRRSLHRGTTLRGARLAAGRVGRAGRGHVGRAARGGRAHARRRAGRPRRRLRADRADHGPMTRVLMTADAVGGVWTYAVELADRAPPTRRRRRRWP